MTDLIAEAVRFAVVVENRSYEQFKKASAAVSDHIDKELFEKLACEQAKNVDALLAKHPGEWYSELTGAVPERAGVNDAHTPGKEHSVPELLHLALVDKRLDVELYLTFAKTFREPNLCAIFEMALDMSRKQVHLLANEQRMAEARLQAAAFLPRRAKRSNLRTELHRIIPNKHTELYFSMLDTGRQSQLG